MISLEQIVDYFNEKFNIYLFDINPFPQYKMAICQLMNDEMNNFYGDEWQKDDLSLREALCISAVIGKCSDTPKGKYEIQTKFLIEKNMLNLPYLKAIEAIEEKYIKSSLTYLKGLIHDKF